MLRKEKGQLWLEQETQNFCGAITIVNREGHQSVEIFSGCAQKAHISPNFNVYRHREQIEPPAMMEAPRCNRRSRKYCKR